VRGKLRRSTTAASVTGTYVVNLDCGREFPYDWSQMKVLASTPRTGWALKRATIIPGLKWLETGAGRFAEPQPLPPVRQRLCCFLGGRRNSRSLNQAILNDKEKTDEHKHRE
jgi:hypothetical protein